MLPLPPAAIDPVSLAIIGGVGAAGLVGLGSAGAIYRWWNRKPPLLPYIPSYIEKLDEADKTPVVRFIAAYHDMMMFMADAHNAAVSRKYQPLSAATLGEPFIAHCDAVIRHGRAFLVSIGSSEAQVRRERAAFEEMQQTVGKGPLPVSRIRGRLGALEQAIAACPRPILPRQDIALPPLSAWDATEREITRQIIQSSPRGDDTPSLSDAELHRWLTSWMDAAVFAGNPPSGGLTRNQRMQADIDVIQRRLRRFPPDEYLSLATWRFSPLHTTALLVAHYRTLVTAFEQEDFVDHVVMAIQNAYDHRAHIRARDASPKTLRRALIPTVHLYLGITRSAEPNPLRSALAAWRDNTRV